MIKKIKTWGGSKALLFSKEETELWDLKEGDPVEITIKKEINWNEMRRRVSDDLGQQHGPK